MLCRITWLAPVGLFSLLTGTAYTQTAGFGVPISGFVYSPAFRAIQPLFGVPGSTYAGRSVLRGLDRASVAPGGHWAFIVKSRSGEFVSGLAEDSPAPVSVSGLIEGADRAVWSRDGSYALVYSSSGQQLQRVLFTAATPSADPPLDLSPWGQLKNLAIDPTGQKMAFSVWGSGVYFFNAGQSPLLISSMSKPAAIAFDDTGSILYAADLDQQQIVRFDSSGTPAVFASLAQADGSVIQPVALAVSGAGRYLLLADQSGQAVRVYEIASGSLANTIALDFPPTRLEALSSGPSFVLNGSNPKEYLLILDARQNPGVYFVPASQEIRK